MSSMRPLRILHVGSGMGGWAGTEKYVVEVASAMRGLGHDAQVACRPGSPLDARSAARGVPRVPLTMRSTRDVAQFPACVAAFRRGWDVVNVHSYVDYVLPPLAARWAHVPLVVLTRHLTHPFRSRLSATACSRWFYDGLVAVSAHVRDVLVSGGVSPERIEVVHNGIDLGALRGAAAGDPRRELGVGPEDALVVAAGRLSPEKGFDDLLLALARLQGAPPRLLCAIAGVGDELERLRARIGDLGLSASVRLLGFRHDVPALFRAADLVVVPSREESFSYTALEAMAMGTPVVACAVGGIPEVVTPDVGRLVPPRDPEALATTLRALLVAPELRAALSGAGPRRAASFDLTATAEGLVAAYRTFALLRREGRR